jgi:hypothetical protein
MVQGNISHRRHGKRILLASLDKVLWCLEKSDGSYRQEPELVKNMLAGDATWETRTLVLVWMLDTVAIAIQLPPRRLLHLFEILDAIGPTQRRTTVKKLQNVLDELRSMALTITGNAGLFSVLQNVLRQTSEQGTNMRLSITVHKVVADFWWLALDLAQRPKRILEVVPSIVPRTMGAQDAAKPGIGGVHFIPLLGGTIELTLCLAPFVLSTQAKLVSFSNPNGTLTNSDLELAASVATRDILAQRYDIREDTIHNYSDSMDTLWWQRKGATSSSSSTAWLIRLQSLHQRHYRCIPTFDYIAGEANAMADACSRMCNLSDSQLLAYF